MTIEPYGSRGRVGIGVPQANPTVEPELGILLADGVSMHITRLNSRAESSRDRLMEYFQRLSETLERYDTLKLDAYGFACTASSYLVGADAERTQVDALAAKSGFPIVTGAGAIVEALRHLGAGRIALASPYPEWLTDLSLAYWRAAGFDIVADVGIDLTGGDTRAIYDVGAEAALENVRKLRHAACDVILITGTGMPSLPAIAALQPDCPLPILSTNLCLAWALHRRLELADDRHPADGRFALVDGWQEKVKRL